MRYREQLERLERKLALLLEYFEQQENSLTVDEVDDSSLEECDPIFARFGKSIYGAVKRNAGKIGLVGLGAAGGSYCTRKAMMKRYNSKDVSHVTKPVRNQQRLLTPNNTNFP